ncbi:receptor-activated Ca2+ cation channel [Heterobasidion irregulare TC 32-1]|uniref:Receptor-activated Ca2+ cation channel n=1 Tax=Heterobasidion irregulare (strain TC 32-1) TaxID=747525 RepID=W4KEA2_HETIT|nr:receptor-activated Ca2+ cation channel [Heterobasidion irregulare TC 32-1]ETW84143.1 receptor-activated Ca2+ cation channel [Heterobasidion irregulare TC 32-1]
MSNNFVADESASATSIKSILPSPGTLARLIKRLKSLTLTLLPLEVSPDAINDPTSRVITPQVISAYIAAAGDFVEALPYCLLRARHEFMLEANRNPADYGENRGRAAACEALARKVVHQAPREKLTTLMSTRFKHRQPDGDIEMSSALEIAIDSHCTIFLSSSEAQDVVDSLWRGDLVQKNNKFSDIDYVPFDQLTEHSFWGHLNPSRLAVPRYQNGLRMVVWLFFLAVYSQAVQEPLDPFDPFHRHLDIWEIILYTMSLAFIYKLLHFATFRAFSFWNFVSFVTDGLLTTAFVLRITGLATANHGDTLRVRSFQVLSYLITVFDGYKYIGTMQICIARMLRESGIFFALLSVLGVGFLQGLYALDAADGQTESVMTVVNVMVQSLLHPAGLLLFYLWNVVTAIVLLNVLISLFSSAYSDVVEDAEAEFLAYFAGKTVSLIRTPDSFVYPAPFNLIETPFIAPFELFLSSSAYATVMTLFLLLFYNTGLILNRYVMSVLFFIPLSIIALYESTRGNAKFKWMNDFMNGSFEEEDSPAIRDPEVDEGDVDEGYAISKVPFSELIKAFPDTQQSTEATITKEIHEVKIQLDALMKLLEARSE